ncbi:PAS domain-containing protein [Parvibaculum sp.]|uniref:PAS domain-containing protein n=1 Tax=Parvibaculum sp. TaxID=2024848 RepID=UPI00272F39B2|nr:PAS domain-containing protein [Parvibaculum sp.]MDP1625675.1 PAS domain-containing protein [Parvibaculum sp.]MDP2149038.1 PAS domain-containing protein [Parvibaculum sp.]MDP3329701.1 PAS domain-containing protein [Parvibaculum sp.]
MSNDEQSAPPGADAPRVPPSAAIQAEYWGEPEAIRPHLTAQAPLDVLDYWLRLRGARRFPSRSDFDPMEMRRHLPNIFLLDVAPGGSFRYRVVGSLISEFFGVGNPAGMTPEDVFGANAEVALSPLRICRDARTPYMHTASASWLYRDRTYVHYEVLLLPFGESDEAVNKVLCCAEFLGEDGARS